MPFEGVEDGLDPLPAAGEVAEPGLFVAAIGSDQVRTELAGDERVELGAGEAFVAEDDLAGSDQVVVVFEQRLGDLAFAEFGGGQSPDDRHSLGGADQVEPEAPEESGVRGAVAVAGVPGQIAAFDGLRRRTARHRGGVDQPQVVVPGVDVTGQFGDHRRQQATLGTEPFAVPRLVGQIGKHAQQMAAGVSDPPSFGRHTEEVLSHGETDQLGVGQLWFSASVIAGPAQSRQDTVLEVDIECGQEGVQVIAHTLTMDTLHPTSALRHATNSFGLTHLVRAGGCRRCSRPKRVSVEVRHGPSAGARS